jgi:hypothetical protein
MRSTRLFALVLALVPAAIGCGDDIKFPDPPEVPDPAINGVIPGEAFAGRTLRVQVSGDGTEFTDAASVAFSGAGITVDSVELASPSDLIANITIAPEAELTRRDVVVTDGDASLNLLQAFEVKSSLIVLADGPIQQGGIAFLRIINTDPSSPFLGDLEIGTTATGTTIIVQGNTETTIDAVVLVDTDAVPGSLVVSDTLGSSVVSSRGDELAVEARAATALTPPGKGPDFQGTGTLNTNTLLFSFTATAGLTAATGRNTTFTAFPPQMVWLVGGKWANARFMGVDSIGFFDEGDPEDEAQGLIPTTAGQQMFVVVFDPDFILGDNYTVGVDEFVALPNVQALAEVEPNDPLDTPPGTAQTLPGAQTLFTGAFADFFDFDVLSVTLTAGQSIRVTTTSGAFGITDSDVRILQDLGDGEFRLVVDFNDENIVEGGEDVQTGPQPAGTYIIEITCSVLADPIDDPYEAAIVIENNNQAFQ